MKCKFKSILALALALMMCVTMLPTAAFAASTETVSIGTPEQFVAFVNEFNAKQHQDANVVLTADIDLGGQEIKPIGDWNNPFTGTFDGKKSDTENYTISNAVIKGYGNWDEANSVIRAGLIGCVNGGTVRNLTLDNITVTNESQSNSSSSIGQNNRESAAGVVVATLVSGQVTNVKTTSTCEVTGYLRTGGIVGDTRGQEGESTVSNCTNEATVVGNNLYTGGIVGAAHDVAPSGSVTGSKITGCTNKGAVTGTTNVGGIVGYADRAVVTECRNEASGVITGLGNYGTGGIMGTNVYNYHRLASIFPSYYPTVSSTIEDCHNYGKITGGRAGGILGAYVSAPGKDKPRSLLDCTIKGCSNTGTITGTVGKCGAIFGYQISYAKGDAANDVDSMGVKIVNCTFDCDVNEAPATVPTPSEISITIS